MSTPVILRYMIMKYFILFVTILFLTSCDKKGQKRLSTIRNVTSSEIKGLLPKSNSLIVRKNELPISIIVPVSSKENVRVSDIVKEINVLALETKKECLIGNIDELVVNKTAIFILDKPQKKVFCFDKKGKFKFLIDSFGKGPGEYIGLSDMYMNRDKLFLLDSDQNKILKYSLEGQFIGEQIISFPYNFQNFGIHENDVMITFTNHIADIVPDLEYDLVTLNDLGKIKSRNLPYNKIYNTYRYNQPTSFYNKNDTLHYISLLKNSVFKIFDGVIEKKYEIDFGKNKVDEERISKLKKYDFSGSLEDNQKILKEFEDVLEQYSLGPNEFFESDSHVIINYLKNRVPYTAYYCKKTKNIKLNDIMSTDGELGILFKTVKPRAMYKNIFYSTVNPNTFLQFHRSTFKGKTLDYIYKRYPKYHSLIQNFEKDENANPHLVIMNFKEF